MRCLQLLLRKGEKADRRKSTEEINNALHKNVKWKQILPVNKTLHVSYIRKKHVLTLFFSDRVCYTCTTQFKNEENIPCIPSVGYELCFLKAEED